MSLLRLIYVWGGSGVIDSYIYTLTLLATHKPAHTITLNPPEDDPVRARLEERVGVRWVQGHSQVGQVGVLP